MSDFTIDDNTPGAVVRYIIDEREIFNDIRSEIGIISAVTEIQDATYSWRYWTQWWGIAPGESHTFMFTSNVAFPYEWKLKSHGAWYIDPSLRKISYYEYAILLIPTEVARTVAVAVTNTGDQAIRITVTAGYRFLSAEKVAIETLMPVTLTARAYDEDSIKKYGRRVYNLTWTEGTNESDMEDLVRNYLARYKEPIARLPVKLVGVTDAIRTQIITREISDRITVNYTNLGFNDDCFIDSIQIKDSYVGMPVCNWGLTAMRDKEKLSLFLIGSSTIGGPDILGS